MSSPATLQTLQLANEMGFRYLYYVATEDPLININRIRHRIRSGGHAVPEDSRQFRPPNIAREVRQEKQPRS